MTNVVVFSGVDPSDNPSLKWCRILVRKSALISRLVCISNGRVCFKIPVWVEELPRIFKMEVGMDTLGAAGSSGESDFLQRAINQCRATTIANTVVQMSRRNRIGTQNRQQLYKVVGC